MGFKISDLFVVFSAQGMETVSKALDTVKGKLEQVQATTEKIASAATASFGYAAAAIGGMVTAGIAASVQGQLLSFQLERLSRTVAGLVGPEIQKFISLVEHLTSWIDHLSAAQKNQLGHLIAASAAFLAVSIILPRVVAGIQSLLGVVSALTAGTGGLLPLLGMIAAGLLAAGIAGEIGGEGMSGFSDHVMAMMEAVASSLGRLMTALEPVLETIGNMLIPLIDSLTEVLNGLNVETLETIVRWVGAATAFVAVLSIAARVVEAVVAITRAIQALNVALAIKAALEGPEGWARLAVGVAAAAAAVGAFYAIESAQEAAHAKKDGSKHGGNRGALHQRLGGPEGVADTYSRIAQASRLVGGGGETDAQKQQTALDKIAANGDKTNQILGNARPVVNRG